MTAYVSAIGNERFRFPNLAALLAAASPRHVAPPPAPLRLKRITKRVVTEKGRRPPQLSHFASLTLRTGLSGS